jgi:membrane fusion protein (multidrug efflux system)
MADPVLKFPPEQKGNPASPEAPPKLAGGPRRRLMAGLRRYRRFLLLVVLPVVALLAGATFYLNGGRYVTTDDAYVGAQKVLITPDISGKVEKVVVKEGQQVAPGDVLFEIDPVPFRLAVAQAKARQEREFAQCVELRNNLRVRRARQAEMTAGERADLERLAAAFEQRCRGL